MGNKAFFMYGFPKNARGNIDSKEPATMVTQFTHTGRVNPNAFHKSISRYLPPMVGDRKASYTPN